MSAERAEDCKIPLHGDEVCGTALDVLNNISHCGIKKHDGVDNTIATSVTASSYNVSDAKKSKKEDPPITKKYESALTSLMAMLIIAPIIVAAVALIAFVQISKLRSDVVLQSTAPGLESTLANNFSTTLVMEALKSIIDTQFSELKDQLNAVTGLVLHTSTNLTRHDNEVNKYLESISDRLSIELSFFISGTTASTNILAAMLIGVLNETRYTFASCAAIQQRSPTSPTGYYHVRSSNGSSVYVYCDMTLSCGNITGGWMRVAELNMTDTTNQCPSSLELLTTPLRTCRIRSSGSALCSSDIFNVDGVGFSKVCGRIRAYQVGTPGLWNIRNIETYYVDGISLTHGRSPRKHIWTFSCAANENEQYPDYKCPCTNTAISSMVPLPPSFVGEEYFCDRAAVARGAFIFYTDDPLWDGAGCGPNSTCCSFNNPPWFYKQLPQPTTDDIEMRVCRDEDRANEDIAIEVVQIYVQ